MRIKDILLFVVFIVYPLFISADNKSEISVLVSPDHSDWNYSIGEKCNFKIRVLNAQNFMSDVKIDYELGEDMYPSEKKKGIILKNGELNIIGRMNKPGFLRCTVKAYVNNREYQGMATVAYSPERIKDHAVMPKDFKTFWDNSLIDARKIPLEPKMELLEDRCTDKVNVYHISFQNVRYGSRTYGILCIPKKEGKYPALLRVPGAGVRSYKGAIGLAADGVITLEIGIHGVPVNYNDEFYANLSNGPLFHYWRQNINNRDEIYYKRVFIGAVRSVDFIYTLPQFDGKTIGVSGGSQGGALSMVVAALDKRISFYSAIHPAMCDHRAYLHNTAGGWPHYYFNNSKPTENIASTLDYYDVVNFAKIINVPGWFSWGYNDIVCPPTSTFAAYNVINATKEFHPYVETGHFIYKEQYEENQKWIYSKLKLKSN